jgi:hypothetical protein
MKDDLILSIRGGVIGSITSESSSEEKFQNQTLRPILKIQNDLLLLVFKNYITKQKVDFATLSPEKKMQFIENAIQRDIKFRNSLKGMVIGFFTLSEYETYIQNSSNLNKRMMNLLIERYKSQIQII